MLEYLQNLLSLAISYITIATVFDIAISTFLIYRLIGWLKGTQAYQVAKGVLFFLILYTVTRLLGLVTLNYALSSFMTAGLVSIVIIFQPELRRALDSIGSAQLLRRLNLKKDDEAVQHAGVQEIIEAMRELGAAKMGALIVIERETQLGDIIDTGVRLDAIVSKNLLLNIFYPNTSLHDGAVIISRDDMRIRAAGCLLPLTQNRNLNKEIGTRHRSAMGISETSDCVSLVVSEETGIFSYAINGRLSRFVDLMTIETVLIEALHPTEHTTANLRQDAM